MKFFKMLLKITGVSVLLLVFAYLFGSKPEFEAFNPKIKYLGISLDQLAPYIAQRESKISDIKPNNHSRIIWADSIRKTNHVLLYLHGFSASPMEGDPTHENFAKRYACNLYIPRLAGHGIKNKDAFEKLTPKALVDSAKEAIAVARLLGDTVILMSCSTGSTLGNYLAAENPKAFHGHIMYSPNFDLADPRSDMLTKNWGLELARQLIGERRTLPTLVGTPKEQYTTVEYKVEGLICLKSLIQSTMTPATFEKVKTPYLLAYYYKNEEEHDKIISIDAIKKFHASTTAVPDDQKRLVPLANVGTHVIPSDLYCKDLTAVDTATYRFAEEVLGLIPVDSEAR